MNKKIIILLIILFGALTIFSIGWRIWSESQTKKDILERSSEFVLVWANYNDSATESYFKAIAPYTSATIVDEYRESSALLLEMRGDKDPSHSNFTIIEGPTIKKDGKSYKTELTGSRKYSFQDEAFVQKVYMNWEKIDGKYLITKVYTDK